MNHPLKIRTLGKATGPDNKQSVISKPGSPTTIQHEQEEVQEKRRYTSGIFDPLTLTACPCSFPNDYKELIFLDDDPCTAAKCQYYDPRDRKRPGLWGCDSYTSSWKHAFFYQTASNTLSSKKRPGSPVDDRSMNPVSFSYNKAQIDLEDLCDLLSDFKLMFPDALRDFHKGQMAQTQLYDLFQLLSDLKATMTLASYDYDTDEEAQTQLEGLYDRSLKLEAELRMLAAKRTFHNPAERPSLPIGNPQDMRVQKSIELWLRVNRHVQFPWPSSQDWPNMYWGEPRYIGKEMQEVERLRNMGNKNWMNPIRAWKEMQEEEAARKKQRL